MEGGGFIPDSVENVAKRSGRADHSRNPCQRAEPSSGSACPRGCSKCQSLSFSDEFFKAFGVLLCNNCRRSEQLLSKASGISRLPSLPLHIIYLFEENSTKDMTHLSLSLRSLVPSSVICLQTETFPNLEIYVARILTEKTGKQCTCTWNLR